ncbi:MAG: ATP-binding protein [Clostridia bacterium]|nr:ATP-binding protein [Clostridia bacterium]
MFIGRENELESLNDSYKSNKAEFIAIYGRRRIGKTELITQFCKDKPTIFYSCSAYPDSEQLKDFSEAVLSYSPEYYTISPFADWKRAFTFLSQIKSDKKLVVAIDEFPYMVSSNKSIPSVLQNLWDHTLRNCNIMLIISGSSISFMEDEILGQQTPLYGRLTGIYKLAPLPYTDAIKFFPSYSDEDKMIAYSILGGVPYYLTQFDPSLSIENNVKKSILKNNSILCNEVEFLIREELREPAVYNLIISAIATGCNTNAEIFSRTQIENRTLSVYIKKLIDLGIIKREYPVLTSATDKERSSKGNLILCDNFFRFWYAYVNKNRSRLGMGDTDGVWEDEIEENLHHFASKIFENICIEYMYILNMRKNLPFRFNEIGRWWGNVRTRDNNGKISSHTEEIDMLASDRDGKRYIIGECKFTASPFDMGQYKSLQAKLSIDGEIYYYLFSLNGFNDAVTKESENNPHITLVTLSDVLSV